MNKWIAEFELEDGDSMPEHMDLYFMGARLDFHCKPVSDCIPIPKDVSNGDVIKAMFPKEEIEEYKDTFGIVFERAERFTICEATFSKAWWNAKYKG